MTMVGWSDFRQEAFGEPYMVWHDGPDFYEFQSRARQDPQTVERVLLQGLSENDPLAAQAVAEADFDDSVEQRLVPVLKEALGRADGTFRVSVAQALHRITGEQHWSSAIVDVLLGTSFWSDRLDAALALRQFTPTIELIAALMRGMQDPEYLVRYHSSNSLLRFGGDEVDVAEHEELFAQIRGDSTSEQWALAASGLAGTASALLQLR
jgi:hypothetical protein